MHLLGLGSHFISLVRSLLTGSRSKAHVNRIFTADFRMLRGVRPGCPLSPLVFVLATQPLMDHLDQEITSGRLKGIQITEFLVICYRLFADDLGMFIPATEQDFMRVEQVLACYELASGTKLNLHKFIVIPLGLEEVPEWLIRM